MKIPFRLAIMIAVAAASQTRGAAFVYTPTEGTTTWSSGVGWDATPVSAMDTTLTFDTGVPEEGYTNTNTNDVASPFQVNVLTLKGTEPTAGGEGIINIDGAPLTMVGTAPQINLDAITLFSGKVIFNVNSQINLGADTTIAGVGVGTFNFNGGISGADYTLRKIGTSAMTLGTTTVKNLAVGLNSAGGTVTMTAGSNLSVGAGASDSFMLSSNTSPSNVVTSGVLNASAASNVTVNVGVFSVGSILGGNPANPTSATLNLGANNSIKAATSFLLGVSTVNPAIGSNHFLTTTDGSTTTIETPLMRVGGLKGGGTFTVGNGASLTVGGIEGERAILDVATWTENIGSGATATSSLDVSGGVFSANLSRLHVANLTQGATAVGVTGSVVLSGNASNHLDISGAGTPVIIGRNGSSGSPNFGNMIGTVTLGNLDATSSITSTDNSTAILIGTNSANYTPGTQWATGTLNLNGGTLTITTTGSAIAGGFAENSANESTVNFNGTTIKAGAGTAVSGKWITNLKTANIGAGGAKFDSNGFEISTDQIFSGSGSLTKLGLGTLTLTGASIYSGDTIVEGGTLSITTGFLSDTGNVLVDGDSVFDLNFVGTDTIHGLVLDGEIAALGTWGSFTSSADNKSALFSGSGILLVTAVVPEPSTLALLAAGIGLFVASRRRAKGQ